VRPHSFAVAGDQPEARGRRPSPLDDLGFDPVDAGGLDASWRQQSGSPAYCQDLDAGALRRALAQAEYSRIAKYRVQEEARIRRSITDQSAKC
jgi:hypothetical protein